MENYLLDKLSDIYEEISKYLHRFTQYFYSDLVNKENLFKKYNSKTDGNNIIIEITANNLQQDLYIVIRKDTISIRDGEDDSYSPYWRCDTIDFIKRYSYYYKKIKEQLEHIIAYRTKNGELKNERLYTK